jgi:Tfp pilus assembly protein PilF
MAKRDYVGAANAYAQADSIESSGLLKVKQHQALDLSGIGAVSDAPLLAWLTAHTDDTDTALYLANYYERKRKYDAAIERYEAMLRLDPNDVRALNNLAWALEKKGDPRGLEYALRASTLQPKNAAILDTVGWLQIAHGQLAQGVQALTTAAALDPDNPEIRYHLAQGLARAENFTGARRELDALLQTDRPFAQREEARALRNRLAQSRYP